MTLVDDLRPLAHELRALRGEFGLARHTVTLVQSVWIGPNVWSDTPTPILHANGQNPKVRFLTLKERTAAGLELAIEVGPLTPENELGGYTAEQLNPVITGRETFHYLVTGPGMGDGGTKFSLAELRVDKALSYRMVLQRSETGELTRPADG